MYSIKEYNGGDGEFTCLGKTYKYRKTVDGSDKRRAKAEMDSDVREARDALAKKLGRRPTEKELLAGGVNPPDERPFRQRLSEEMVHTSGDTGAEEVRNPYQPRLEFLESQHPLRREERSALKRRIQQAKGLSTAWEAQHAEQIANQKENDRISSAVVDAKASVALMRSGGTSEEIRTAQKLLDTLLETHDVEAYFAQAALLSASRKARLEESAQALEAQAEEQRKLAAEVRRGESPAPPEAPQAQEANTPQQTPEGEVNADNNSASK